MLMFYECKMPFNVNVVFLFLHYFNILIKARFPVKETYLLYHCNRLENANTTTPCMLHCFIRANRPAKLQILRSLCIRPAACCAKRCVHTKQVHVHALNCWIYRPAFIAYCMCGYLLCDVQFMNSMQDNPKCLVY